MNDSYLNKKYGMLTIISLSENRKHYVLAKCECGQEKEYFVFNIKSGHTKSCGCFQRLGIGGLTITHGKSKDPIYKLWINIKKRCFNVKCKAYPDYGGRGITMCDEWNNDFMSFYKWCLANNYSKGLEIDREDNDDDYKPSNCRFVTRIINANNKRDSHYVCYNGEKKTIAQWAAQFNISALALHSRLFNNWNIHDALTFPVLKRGGCYNRYKLIKQQMPQDA